MTTSPDSGRLTEQTPFDSIQDGLHSQFEEAPPYRAVVDANRQLTGPV
jgi:hypothetical protein